MIDRRFASNFLGGWVTQEGTPADVFLRYAPSLRTNGGGRYRVGLETGEGQHVLITSFGFRPDAARQLSLRWVQPVLQTEVAATVALEAEISNVSAAELVNIPIRLIEPYGYGLAVQEEAEKTVDRLQPGEKKILSWKIKAQRPDAVNLGKPWEVALKARGMMMTGPALVSVADNRPGTLYYVMTEDLEPIDSAGYGTRWGNAGGWLDPEEFRVQIIHKAEALNKIAEKYGAKWTHYLAMPVLRGGEWAASQSTRPNWKQTLADIKTSVTEQSVRGHEYALHLHGDYDPRVSGNLLSYNPVDDGFWANHLKHGWAHQYGREGSPDDINTRIGILYDHQTRLSEWVKYSPEGQPITARTGSFDFGNRPEVEAASLKAYRQTGLWGNSDAGGNMDGLSSGGDYGREIYITSPNNINVPLQQLKEPGLVEFRPTPRQPILYDVDSADVMNRKTAEGVTAFLKDGKIRSGVHAVVGFSHAMLIMGEPDWRSTTGGKFQSLSEHLAYLKNNYVAKKLMRFGTAKELVRDYLDYYWPEPLALYGKLLNEERGSSVFAMDILGKDIPIDTLHPRQLEIACPLYLRESAYKAAVFKNGRQIGLTYLFMDDKRLVSFVVDDRSATYTLKIYHDSHLRDRLLTLYRWIYG